jgi:hypothetical protein
MSSKVRRIEVTTPCGGVEVVRAVDAQEAIRELFPNARAEFVLADPCHDGTGYLGDVIGRHGRVLARNVRVSSL